MTPRRPSLRPFAPPWLARILTGARARPARRTPPLRDWPVVDARSGLAAGLAGFERAVLADVAPDAPEVTR